MSVATFSRKLKHFLDTSLEFRDGFFAGLFDGARSSFEDLALGLATSAQRLVDAVRALLDQNPEKALRLFTTAFKRSGAKDRARLASDLDPGEDDWHARGYRQGHLLGYLILDKLLLATTARTLQSFRLTRQLHRSTRRFIGIGTSVLRLSDHVQQRRAAAT